MSAFALDVLVLLSCIAGVLLCIFILMKLAWWNATRGMPDEEVLNLAKYIDENGAPMFDEDGFP